jgi:hypothetical protein
VDDATEVKCDKCGAVLSRDESLWLELAPGNLRIALLSELDDTVPFTRAWHVRCASA